MVGVVSFHEQAFGQQLLRIIASIRKRSVTIKNKTISGKTENITWDCPTKAMPSKSYFASTRKTDFRNEQGDTAEMKKTNCIRIILVFPISILCGATVATHQLTENEARALLCASLCRWSRNYSRNQSIGRLKNRFRNHSEAPEINRASRNRMDRPKIIPDVQKNTRLRNVGPNRFILTLQMRSPSTPIHLYRTCQILKF